MKAPQIVRKINSLRVSRPPSEVTSVMQERELWYHKQKAKGKRQKQQVPAFGFILSFPVLPRFMPRAICLILLHSHAVV
jgi:hypothetical protein